MSQQLGPDVSAGVAVEPAGEGRAPGGESSALEEAARSLEQSRRLLQERLAENPDYRALQQLQMRENGGQPLEVVCGTTIKAKLIAGLESSALWHALVSVERTLEQIKGSGVVLGDAVLALAAAASIGRDARASPMAGPPRPQAPDDLTRIRGIDRAMERRLLQHGVVHYQQIAAWSAEDVLRIRAALGVGRGISQHGWIEQAALLAAGKPTRHAAQHALGLERALAPPPELPKPLPAPTPSAAEGARQPDLPATLAAAPTRPPLAAKSAGPAVEAAVMVPSHPMPAVEVEPPSAAAQPAAVVEPPASPAGIEEATIAIVTHSTAPRPTSSAGSAVVEGVVRPQAPPIHTPVERAAEIAPDDPGGADGAAKERWRRTPSADLLGEEAVIEIIRHSVAGASHTGASDRPAAAAPSGREHEDANLLRVGSERSSGVLRQLVSALRGTTG